VVKHVDAAKLRIAVAAVLAAAADAALVAHHLPKFGAHLVAAYLGIRKSRVSWYQNQPIDCSS
jgi:hypothetical protein